MRKVALVFLVPFGLFTAAAVAVRLWGADPPPRPSELHGTTRPALEGFTPDAYARFVEAYPAQLGGRSGALVALLWDARQANRHLDAYRLVDPADAPEAFRVLAYHLHTAAGGVANPPVEPPLAALRELVGEHARASPDDPLLGVYRAVLLYRGGRPAEAEPLAEAAVGWLAGGTAGGRSLASADVALVAELRTAVYVDLGRWETATPADLPNGVTFEGLFNHLNERGRPADSDRLLARWAAVAPDDRRLLWCQMHRAADRKDYSACLAAADRFLKAEPQTWDRQAALERRIAALAHLGRFPEAEEALTRFSPERTVAWSSAAAELLIAVLSGDAARVDRLFGSRAVDPARAYADPDLGRLRTDPAFAAVRANYPPPAERRTDSPGRRLVSPPP